MTAAAHGGIALVEDALDIDAARALMRAYAASIGIDLCFQHFETELEALPGAYVAPRGGLWLARDDRGAAVGVIALRPLSAVVCEMKRLWVEPRAQGTGLGRALAQTTIDFARAAGYASMKLDTLQHRMPAAVSLYRSLGFVACAAYTVNPEPDVLYMELDLAGGDAAAATGERR
ncbi:MAG: GNAT family N-acetyltransferase [Burkholderiales bacterium]|nr:GNAT family N-acetyltransferase [Burkholderiales bacterium]